MKHASRLLVTALLLTVMAGASLPVRAESWSAVERSDEAKRYVEQLRKGTFDGDSKTFLEQTALPILVSSDGLDTVSKTRRRMLEVLFDSKGDAKAREQANAAAAAALVSMASDISHPAGGRVNAVLRLGELRGEDGRSPWNGAVPFLTSLAGNDKLQSGIRAAAMTGLARHVDALRKQSEIDEKTQSALSSCLLAIIAAPPSATEPSASEWLVGRALDMLPVAEKKASPATAKALTELMTASTRTIDVRVRAAAALGAIIAPDSAIDGPAAVLAIRDLAIEAIQSDIDATLARALIGSMAGVPTTGRPGSYERGGIDGGMPGAVGPNGEMLPPAEPIDLAIVRRDAWRLLALANATASGDGSSGLVTVTSDGATATRLAGALREWAMNLAAAADAWSGAASMKDAVDALAKIGPVTKPTAASSPAAAASPAAVEAPPAAQPRGNDPFGAPN